MKEWGVFEPTESHIYEDSHGLLRVKFGTPTENEKQAIDEAHWLVGTFAVVKKERPEKPIHALVDMTSIDDSEFIPGQVWKMYLEMVRDPFLERVAVAGGTETMRGIINFYFDFWSRQNVKFFPDVGTAQAWLRGKV